MAVKHALGKRSKDCSSGPNKRSKVTSTSTSSARGRKGPALSKDKGKGKDHAFDRPTIPIPALANSDESDSEVADEDLDFFAEHASAATGFAQNLDLNGIQRSKKEQLRLHKLSKPQPSQSTKDDKLPSLDSHSEDEDSWSSDISEDSEKESVDSAPPVPSSSTSRLPTPPKRKFTDDSEMPYERLPRKVHMQEDSDNEGISKLPIKSLDGKILRFEQRVKQRKEDDAQETPSEDDMPYPQEEPTRRDDIATGARFGRPAVIDVIGKKSRQARIQAAKAQIASICQDIVGDPENSLGLLRRLHTFCLAQITTPTHPEPVENDVLIRKLALLSQLAVFKDIIPGYRIRQLTEKEKAEKVSQAVQRTRDFEQGLVSVYQSYLRILESEVKSNSELADTSLQCICTLLTDLTHFNFRVNLMTVVVSRLSKKKWDEPSQLCAKTISSVFRLDRTGQASLDLVRLLNRMVKERQYNVHPNIVFCLLDLRLKTELGGVRASQSQADAEKRSDGLSKGKAAARRAKGKSTATPHLSKKARKKAKEIKEIEDEMREAEAEVDSEERSNTQTETLKLLFVLYFRILKNDKPTPLLPAALQGISRFAHLVNIDFFRDLLQVLREHVSRSTVGDDTLVDADSLQSYVENMHIRLQCIVTAFELLSGQGEALSIDLSDFVNHLFALITPLSIMPGAEDAVAGTRRATGRLAGSENDSPSNMLFRALNLAFSSRSISTKPPPWQTAAFAKRLLTASLHFPPQSAVRAIGLVYDLFAKEPKLDALLSADDRVTNGIYRPDVDDPQLSNAFASSIWELSWLTQAHVDYGVREAASKLLQYDRER